MSKRQSYPYGTSLQKKGLSSKDWVGIALILLAFVMAGGVGYWNYAAKQSRVVYNNETYCPESGPYARTVLLVDLSDEISFIQEQRLRNFIHSLADPKNDEAVPQHTMMSVYLLNEEDNATIPTAVVEVCNPGSGEGLSEFTGNPRLANKRFTERFVEPIDAAIGQVVHAGSTKTSPIIESIRGISVSAFAKEPEPGFEHRLIVISDMLQNTKVSSHYRHGQQIDEKLLANIKADLKRVDRIDIKVIARRSVEGLQGKSLVEYWRKYFRASGSNLTTAERWGE